MTRDHDWAIYDDPVFCRNCGMRKLDAYSPDGGFIKCVGGFRYGVKEGELDGSIARDLREIQANEGRLALPPGSQASPQAPSGLGHSVSIPIATGELQ